MFHPLNQEKVIITQILFSDYKYCLIHFWSIVIELSGIKSEQENKFESLGTQKIDFYVLGKQSIFQWKIDLLFKM